jgi:phosphoribosylanthranilate isomerase
MLDWYDSEIPFFLSGGISTDDVEKIKEIHHDLLYGIDINSKFEIEPGLKDIEKVKTFITHIRK